MRWRTLFTQLVLCRCAALAPRAHDVLILGGSGRIGTAIASHLLLREPRLRVLLAGRDAARDAAAVAEVRAERGAAAAVDFAALDWRDAAALGAACGRARAVVHAAGPYLGEPPAPLRAAIAARCAAYVDVADPLEYLDAAAALDGAARDAGATARSSRRARRRGDEAEAPLF